MIDIYSFKNTKFISIFYVDGFIFHVNVLIHNNIDYIIMDTAKKRSNKRFKINKRLNTIKKNNTIKKSSRNKFKHTNKKVL
jgi:hypothetical protein